MYPNHNERKEGPPVGELFREENPFRDLGAIDDLTPPALASSYQHQNLFATAQAENSLDPSVVWRSTMGPVHAAPAGGDSIHAFDDEWGMPVHKNMASLHLDPKHLHDGAFKPSKELHLDQWNKYQPKELVEAVQVVSADRRASELPPLAPGGYMEPNFHFFSKSQPEVLFQAVQNFLESEAIDFIIKPAKFKFKCVTYPDGARIPFFVRLFATSTPNQYAVEFQRRSGCVVQFSDLYRHAKATLWSLGHVTGEDKPPAPAKFEPPALDVEVSVAHLSETMKCLVSMASSSFVDVQTQAVLALSEMTKTLDTRDMMADGLALELMVDNLSSSRECVHRCAITSLANLAEGRQGTCEQLAAKKVVPTLVQYASSDCPQVARESVRALANMGQILREGLCDLDPNLKCELPQLARTNDAQMRSYAETLQQCVGLAF